MRQDETQLARWVLAGFALGILYALVLTSPHDTLLNAIKWVF